MSIHRAASKGYQAESDAYERGRPDYPHDALEHLRRRLELQPGKVVVDLGAGTGKFTRLLCETGASIIAVEPVAAMRQKLAAALPDVDVFDGTAEQMPLADASVDAIVVAQAFHWFDGPSAVREILRVLKPGGHLGLIWNARDESHRWVEELTTLIDRHEGDAPRYRTGRWRRAFEGHPSLTPLDLVQFPHGHRGPPEIVVDRVASISFIAALPEATKATVLDEVRSLVRSHPETRDQSEIIIPYRTDVFTCRRVS